MSMNRLMPLALAAWLLGGASCLGASAQTAPIPRYAEFQASFTLPHQTGNPYDPKQNDIDVAFHTPAGATELVPAFWDGDRWRVRFTPARVGAYTLSVLRSGQPARPIGLAERGFRCAASSASGFVRRDPAAVQAFQFDDGQAYYPLGENAAWSNGPQLDYDLIFQRFHDADLNWMRVWMNYWDGKNLEWAKNKADQPPIGRYDLNAARRWDHIFDLATRDHVYIQMTLQHHGEYTREVDSNWNDNPWNVVNGGFLKNPDDFFTDPRAITLTKAKYRYIVARWGYSPYLLAYELFNEVQNIREASSHFGDVVAWHKMMADYIRSIDTNHHLLTTSILAPGEPLSTVGLDYDQVHIYSPAPAAAFAALPWRTAPVPLFVGEWGPSPFDGSDEALVRDSLWSSLMVPTAGAAQFWYYDGVEKYGWWPDFSSAGHFARAYNVASLVGSRSIRAAASPGGPRTTLSFAPALGYAPTTNLDVSAPPSGDVTGLGQISSYIQGTSNRSMMTGPIVIHLDSPAATTVTMTISGYAKAGAHPTLSVDGARVAEKEYAASDKDQTVTDTLSASVPAGMHTVSIFNTGQDWFTVQQISIPDYAQALAVSARGTRRSAIFFVAERQPVTAVPAGATLTLTGLAPGRYRVRYWSVQAAQPLPETTSRASAAGTLTMPLPTVPGEVAGRVDRD